MLEKHPDKQPGNKKAAEEFIKIQRAYEIITDDKAREAWAALQRHASCPEQKSNTFPLLLLETSVLLRLWSLSQLW